MQPSIELMMLRAVTATQLTSECTGYAPANDSRTTTTTQHTLIVVGYENNYSKPHKLSRREEIIEMEGLYFQPGFLKFVVVRVLQEVATKMQVHRQKNSNFSIRANQNLR